MGLRRHLGSRGKQQLIRNSCNSQPWDPYRVLLSFHEHHTLLFSLVTS